METPAVQFLVLMVLMTACAMDWPSSLDPLSSTVATATVVAASAVMMAWLGLDVRRRLRSGTDAEEVFVRYSRWRTRHLLGLLAAALGALGAFGWGATAKALCTVQRDGHAWILPGAELLNLLPFVAGLVLAWLIGYDAER